MADVSFHETDAIESFLFSLIVDSHAEADPIQNTYVLFESEKISFRKSQIDTITPVGHILEKLSPLKRKVSEIKQFVDV
jgi:hypothetical protein